MSAEPISREVRHFPDLRFSVIAAVFQYHVDYQIYDICGWMEGATKGVFDVPVWDDADRLEDAPVYLHGFVKWDGCSNWYFDEQDRVMLHGCGISDIQRFGDIMAECWNWAGLLCPAWNP